MAEQEVHRPGEQQVIHRSHQAQAICMAELWSLQAKVNVGAAVMAPPVTAKKDDASAAVQAAIVNVAGVESISAGGGLIQTTSG